MVNVGNVEGVARVDGGGGLKLIFLFILLCMLIYLLTLV